MVDMLDLVMWQGVFKVFWGWCEEWVCAAALSAAVAYRKWVFLGDVNG